MRKQKPKLKNLFEHKIYSQLKRAKVPNKYEPRKIPYVLARHYIPDWEIDTPLGKILIETKGYFRPEDKQKLLAVKRQNPQLDIRIVFYSKKLKDIKWCEKNGFKYAIERIPKEWLKGL